MFKRKNKHIIKTEPRPSKLKVWFQKFVQKFQATPTKPAQSTYPTLEEATIDDLRLEELTSHLKLIQQDDDADVEIAFVNPDTGELEVVSLPNDVFKVQVREIQTSSSDTESMVVLEVDSPLNLSGRAEEEDDISTRITHFPPHGRLH